MFEMTVGIKIKLYRRVNGVRIFPACLSEIITKNIFMLNAVLYQFISAEGTFWNETLFMFALCVCSCKGNEAQKCQSV